MGRNTLARKSNHSNKSKKKTNGDSVSDSGESEVTPIETKDTDDAPVVIEGEAEDITDNVAEDADALEDSVDPEQLDQDVVDAANEVDEITETEVETVETENSEIESTPPPPPVAAEPQRGSVMPLVFGGIVAGAIGYGASYFDVLSQQGANDEQAAVEDTSALDARFDELSAELGTLSSEYSGLADEVAGIAPTDTAPLTERLESLSSDVAALQNLPTASDDVPAALVERMDGVEADLAGQLAGLNEQIEALETDVTGQMASLTERISGLEDRLSDMQMAAEAAPDPIDGMSEEQLATFQSELDQLTAQATAQVEQATAQVEQATAEVTAAKERASEFEQKAADAAALAERNGAIAALTSAVENGSGFAEELAFFDDPPKALTATAENGVPTLSALQRAFPDVARAALATATVVPQDASATDRLTAFLKRQTNARSLAPKEGDGVDAVLSRAEASVSNGDLVTSLEELSTLPEEAKDILGPWIADAQSRLDALAALSEISAAEN